MQAADSKPLNTPDKESLRSLNDALEKHFPRPVEDTELVLMDVSPHRLHAYWHITPWELKSARSRLKDENAKLILRFHDLTEPPRKQETAPSFDIEITGATGSQYVELWEDAKSYVAELGLLMENGRLLDLARSNTVELPKASQSARHGAQVLILTPSADTLFEASPSSDSIDPQKARETWQEDVNQPNDATLQRGLSKLFPLFPDPGAPVFEAHKLDLDFPAGKTPSMSLPEQEIVTPQSTDLPPNKPSTLRTGQENEVPQSDDPASSKPSILSTADALVIKQADSFPLCSIADAHALAKERIKPLAPLDSLQAAAAKVPSGFAFSPFIRKTTGPIPTTETAAERIATTSSPGSPQPVSSFSLAESPDQELHIELHIHGRAQPNSQFVFHGQLLATEADGSFSLHKRLPPEAQQLVAQLLTGSHSREE